MQEPHLQHDQIPRHVAIIMDGNGRWAESRGLDRNDGHREGLESVRAVVRGAHEIGIGTLTLYAFSMENWNRPKSEVKTLMGLLEHYLKAEIDEVMKNGIRVRAIGRSDRLPPGTRVAVEEAVERTRDNCGMDLVFALSYGGRTEIVDAVKKLLRDAELGNIDPEHIDEKTFASYLYEPDVRDPDLLIRTGAESRVSNFCFGRLPIPRSTRATSCGPISESHISSTPSSTTRHANAATGSRVRR